MIEEVVIAEGPIHHERLAKLVCSAFGLTRVTLSRVQSVVDLLPAAWTPDASEPFAWLTSRRPGTWTGFHRASPDAPRAVDHVSLHELGNAMVSIAEAAYGIERDELPRETLSVFGGRHLTPNIEDRLDAALIAALQKDHLTMGQDGVLRPARAT